MSHSPSAHVLGAYRVEATPELLATALELKYGEEALEGDDRREAESAVRGELSRVVLLEARVRDRDSRFDVGDFGQEGSEQAPYDERFLSQDGSQVVADGFDVPAGGTFRVAFFLHDFDPTKRLQSSYGPLDVPGIQPMPERLRGLVPYEPVD